MKIFKKLYYRYKGYTPETIPMVKYWRTQNSVDAKLTKAKDGSQIMYMEGEDYPIQGFPRGFILFGSLSKLKHEIKDQIFNDSWKKLETGVDKKRVIKDIKSTLFNLKVRDTKTIDREYQVGEDLYEIIKYDQVPPEGMCPQVREIHRAWTKVSPETSQLRDIVTHILQEDDGYRLRVQWLFDWFMAIPKLNPVASFNHALMMLEHGEVIGDMKERQRLFKRILGLCLEDESIKKKFIALFREINWRKVKLRESDRYQFRAKYFKCDLGYLEY